jgi:hypothetical protein
MIFLSIMKRHLLGARWIGKPHETTGTTPNEFIKIVSAMEAVWRLQ